MCEFTDAVGNYEYSEKSHIYSKKSPVYSEKSPMNSEQALSFMKRALYILTRVVHILKRDLNILIIIKYVYDKCCLKDSQKTVTVFILRSQKKSGKISLNLVVD